MLYLSTFFLELYLAYNQNFMERKWEKALLILLISAIVLISIVIIIGVFWGRNTIEKDTLRKVQDEEQLDKLHQLRK